jgi:hypothetical protein
VLLLKRTPSTSIDVLTLATTVDCARHHLSRVVTPWMCRQTLGSFNPNSKKNYSVLPAVVLVAGACVGSVPTRWAKYHALFSAAFLLAGGTMLILVLPLVAPVHQSAATIFLNFDLSDVAKNGLPNVAYMFLIGTIMPQGTFIGFEL